MNLDFFKTAANLKKIPRQGWIDKLSIDNPESVADHSYSMAIMSMLISDLENYNFDAFIINLYVDGQGDWLAHFQEMPNISAFGDTPQQALQELKIAWELVKDDYKERNMEIPVANNRQKILN